MATIIRSRKIRYVYFLPSNDQRQLVLKSLFQDSLDERLLRESITVIEIRDAFLLPFVFRPPGALLVGQQGALGGVWGKLTERDQRIGQLYEMDNLSVVQLYQKLSGLKRELETKYTEMDRSIYVSKLHPLRKKKQ